MRSCGLDTTARGRDEAFNSRCVQSSSEFLLLGLDTRDNWDSEEIFVDLSVKLEDLANFGVSFGFC